MSATYRGSVTNSQWSGDKDDEKSKNFDRKKASLRTAPNVDIGFATTSGFNKGGVAVKRSNLKNRRMKNASIDENMNYLPATAGTYDMRRNT